jgi:hypothetical protein
MANWKPEDDLTPGQRAMLAHDDGWELQRRKDMVNRAMAEGPEATRGARIAFEGKSIPIPQCLLAHKDSARQIMLWQRWLTQHPEQARKALAGITYTISQPCPAGYRQR